MPDFDFWTASFVKSSVGAQTACKAARAARPADPIFTLPAERNERSASQPLGYR